MFQQKFRSPRGRFHDHSGKSHCLLTVNGNYTGSIYSSSLISDVKFSLLHWTINGIAFDMMNMKPMFHLKKGKRYRLHMQNASDDIHPMHLHRHSFEITNISGQPTSGIIKDVAMLGGFQEMDIDFTADNPGLTLLHCHMQLHMDFGFMALFDYV